MTDRTHPTDKESPMTPKTRHDELKALLSKISEESVTTSNALADMLDLLRERLPEPEGVKDEPAPADDLPGEPVEPGDLRAGDRVGFTWNGGRIIGALVSDQGVDALRSDAPDSGGYSPNVVHKGREWCAGISNVRLIERAPREDEEPDEALARVIFGDAYGSHEGLRLAQLDMARAAREHIEAEQESRERTVVDEWDDMLARAKKAEEALRLVREALTHG